MRQHIAILLISALFFSTISKSQTPIMPNKNNNYDLQWSEIAGLEQKGLPKSILEKVTLIYDRAKKDKNAPQIIKSILFREKYAQQLVEQGESKSIEKWVKEAAEADFPVKPLLQSMLAEIYKTFLQNNIWQLQNRTTTVDFKNDDLNTWTIKQLSDEAAKYYLLSLQDERSQQRQITDFDAIISKGNNSETLRPTLYDFLAHRAIDYFANEVNHLAEPSYKFVIEQDEAYSSVEKFVTHQFVTKDSTSNKLQAIKIFQTLLQKNLTATPTPALIDADLKRIQFVHTNSVIDNKDSLYLKALNEMRLQYSTGDVLLFLAQYHYQKGQNYQPNPDSIGKWELQEAIKLCEECNQKFPNSNAANTCNSLKNSILQKNLQLQVELVNLPNKPFLAKIDYKNLSQVHLKIIKFSDKMWRELEHIQQHYEEGKNTQVEVTKYLNAQTSIKNWTVELPNDGDHNSQSTEVGFDKQIIGIYAVLVSDNEQFLIEKGAVAYALTHVSNIAYLYRQDEIKLPEFIVTDRTTGEPMINLKAEIFVQQYNLRGKNEMVKEGNAVTNDRGFMYPRLQQNKYYTLRFINGKDTLHLNQGFSHHQYPRYNQTRQQTFFFLDRAIYRPGQTVYFKGLVVEFGEKNLPKILPNRDKIQVTFNDANGQKISTQSLATNEFGTFNGSFVAPTAGLLGQMSIQTDLNGQVELRVEEYKRPKFDVTFKPIEVSYRINDMVTVKGESKAFAGNNIDGAKVKFRVTRSVRYPDWFWRWCYYRPIPRGEAQEIVTGETVTNADGNFIFTFKALPDRSELPKNKPEFNYVITADVTDINGETHSQTTTVTVGYIAMTADIEMPEQVDFNNFKNIKIVTKNLNGQPEKAKGTLTVHALISPKRVFNERFWTKPKVYLMEKAEYVRLFPQYAYENEDLMQNWKKKTKAFSTNFDTEKTSAIELGKLDKTTWEPGAYSVTLKTQDKFGEAIEVIKYFTLYRLRDKLIPTNQNSFIVSGQPTHEPGDTAMVHIGTAADKIKVLFEIERHGEIVNSQWVDVTKFEHLDFPILENDRGNIHCHISYIKNNRAYSETQTILVPWSNKDLKIEYATFRDKLEPGAEDTWQIKILGNKKEKVVAEMLATMYDESLDQFVSHNWNLSLFPTSYASKKPQIISFQAVQAQLLQLNWYNYGGENFSEKTYDYLNWFGGLLVNLITGSRRNEGDYLMDGVRIPAPMMQTSAKMKRSAAPAEMTADAEIAATGASLPPPPEVEDKNVTKSDFSGVQIRKNLNETVFFLPNLMTDAEGNIILKFKMNEALTRWKFLGLAHTKDLKFGLTQRSIVTQKELMIVPNPPRFLRESDTIELTAKINNLTKETLKGNAILQLFDAVTMQPIDDILGNNAAVITFTSVAGQSVPLAWRLQVPVGKVGAVTYKMVAKTVDFSDGEENSLPVLTNRMLVTESMPLPVRGGQKKNFTFESLKNASASTTLQHHKYTLEFTQNPAWYAVQALPYLMEYPHQCSEQIFNRFYANTLASAAANSQPKIQNIFEKWKNTDALLSNLSKNQELKTALLEETPWVLSAQNEAQQKKNIGLLFDLQRMATEQKNALQMLADRQLSNGGFTWFSGGRDDWYITQYMVEGMGHLDKLNVTNIRKDDVYSSMLNKALAYTDARFLEMYQALERDVKVGTMKWENDNLDYMAIHYLYTRSFFKDYSMGDDVRKAQDYYLKQAQKHWLQKSIYMQGMLALALFRNDLKQAPLDIVKSLKERAINSEELGMYWKQTAGFYWYQLPLETHALLIEVFSEIVTDEKTVDDLKVWLIKNKQTNQWKTTKSTAAAVYALLLNGNNWLAEDKDVNISIGGKLLDQSNLEKEAGTGYFKTSWKGENVTPEMATIEVENPNSVVSWGAVYWQYFEQLDKIKSFRETPLTIVKKLFKEEMSDNGLVIRPILDSTELKVGDKIVVRIEIRVDRPMEYVHMKDSRAAGFEPINVLSVYKWQGSLGYYESTSDAATNFFMGYLPKGTHVFEYPLRVQQRGNFSNGITTLQCMYAPEFSSHSEGVRVKVK